MIKSTYLLSKMRKLTDKKITNDWQLHKQIASQKMPWLLTLILCIYHLQFEILGSISELNEFK